MLISEIGILLSLRKLGEKSLIARCFLEKSGVVAGFIKYQKHSLPCGSIVHAKWRARMQEHLGCYVMEPLEHNLTHRIILDYKKSVILASGLDLINLILPEKEPNTELWNQLYLLIGILSSDESIYNCIQCYILLELKILQIHGFFLSNLKDLINDRNVFSFLSILSSNMNRLFAKLDTYNMKFSLISILEGLQHEKQPVVEFCDKFNYNQYYIASTNDILCKTLNVIIHILGKYIIRNIPKIRYTLSRITI